MDATKPDNPTAPIAEKHRARSGSCDGCKHIVTRIISPDGKRLRSGCKIYKGLTAKCADWSAK